MDRRRLWPNLLCAAGIVVSVLGGRLFFGGELRHGTISELCLLSGSALVALGGFFGKSRHRAFVYSAPGLALISLSAWIAYSIWLAAHHSHSVSWIIQYPLPLIYWLALWTSLTSAMLVLFASPRASMPAPGGVSMDASLRGSFSGSFFSCFACAGSTEGESEGFVFVSVAGGGAGATSGWPGDGVS